jgi:hypothetical protein
MHPGTIEDIVAEPFPGEALGLEMDGKVLVHSGSDDLTLPLRVNHLALLLWLNHLALPV